MGIIDLLLILICAGLIGLILLQQRGTGLGEVFGGQGGSFFHIRRGLEKYIFWSTIGLAFLFIFLSILRIYL